jgi:hypothetical protein
MNCLQQTDGRNGYKCTNIESEPGVRATEQNFAVLPSGEVSSEIGKGSPGRFCALDNSIWVDYESSGGQDVLDIFRGLLNVALDIHSETGGFGDGKTEVKGDAAGNAAKTDENTPHVIDMVEGVDVVVQDGVLESSDKDQANQSSSCKT